MYTMRVALNLHGTHFTSNAASLQLFLESNAWLYMYMWAIIMGIMCSEPYIPRPQAVSCRWFECNVIDSSSHIHGCSIMDLPDEIHTPLAMFAFRNSPTNFTSPSMVPVSDCCLCSHLSLVHSQNCTQSTQYACTACCLILPYTHTHNISVQCTHSSQYKHRPSKLKAEVPVWAGQRLK